MNLIGLGLKRLARRPSGLIASQVPGDQGSKKDTKGKKETKESKDNSDSDVPSVSITIPQATSESSYPTPLSAKPSSSIAPAPSTPPRAKNLSLAVPRSGSPLTPSRSLPMSPVLSANPALSPPPARKPSLTRMQLDFGIKPDDEEDSDDNDGDGDGDNDGEGEGMGDGDADADADALDEGNTEEATGAGMIDFARDRSLATNTSAVKRGAKRKTMEDDAEEIVRPADTSISQRPLPTRKREKPERRDTGTALNTTELKERASKEGLRDVTNEANSSPPKLSNGNHVDQPPSGHDKNKIPNGDTTQDEPIKKDDSHRKAAMRSIAGITAKLERITSSARPRPLPTNVTLPPPSRNNSTVSLQETLESLRVDLEPTSNGDPNTGEESDPSPATAELGRRNSGRQRKSVNYKEPSLIS